MTDKVKVFAILVGVIGWWCSPVMKLFGEKHYENYQRRKLFRIEEPDVPAIKLERPAKEIAWQEFVYERLLNMPSITWVYGAKRVGKSTELQKNTFKLQGELDKGKLTNIEKYI